MIDPITAYSFQEADLSKMINPVTDLPKEVGMDEIYEMFFRCAYCKDEYIIDRFKYCPNCGQLIEWGDHDPEQSESGAR